MNVKITPNPCVCKILQMFVHSRNFHQGRFMGGEEDQKHFLREMRFLSPPGFPCISILFVLYSLKHIPAPGAVIPFLADLFLRRKYARKADCLPFLFFHLIVSEIWAINIILGGESVCAPWPLGLHPIPAPSTLNRGIRSEEGCVTLDRKSKSRQE